LKLLHATKPNFLLVAIILSQLLNNNEFMKLFKILLTSETLGFIEIELIVEYLYVIIVSIILTSTLYI
jgi:hypothetical protein